MLIFDLTEENDTSETTVAYADGAVKESITVDEETRKKFEKDNKIVRRHLLNYMSNSLFNLFITFKSAKII